jgi:hypothetical protein
VLSAGKAGVGKSSTANSILAEKVAHVAVMQSDMSKAQSISRTAAGFNLTIIDTPGALEGDALNGAVLPRLHRDHANPHRPSVMLSFASAMQHSGWGGSRGIEQDTLLHRHLQGLRMRSGASPSMWCFTSTAWTITEWTPAMFRWYPVRE